MQIKILAAYSIAFVFVCFIWPTLKVWRRYGVWPLVFYRRARPGQILMGFFFKVTLIGLLALSILAAWWSTDSLLLINPSMFLTIIGWGLLIAGSIICTVAQYEMGASWRIGIDDRPTDLVTTGLFKYSRNPIFTGVLFFVSGYIVVLPSCWSLSFGVALWAGIRLQTYWEEAHLLTQHGQRYRIYANRVGRFLPAIGCLKMPKESV